MGWPPQIREELPRAAECWCEQTKLLGWVLGEEGHGEEWLRVMHVSVEDAESVWEAISAAVAQARVTGVRDLGRFGVNCEVDAVLAIGERSATIRTIWHYAAPDAAPRLVSAFPRP
jgi:Domain of unknown function (DUF6883)